LNLFYLLINNQQLSNWNKKLIISILTIITPLVLWGQAKYIPNSTENNSDTITVTLRDTTFLNNQKKYDDFYDSLANKNYKNKLTKAALNLLIVNQPNTGKFIGIENLRNEEYFKLYTGKTIRKIEILKLDVFGPTLSNPLQHANGWIENAGNKTHINTRDFIIKNNLFFDPGDKIDPAQLVDNERLLRELDYIKDASIEIAEIPGNDDMVDVLVITKDVFSAGIYLDLYNSSSGAFEIYENNIAGIGHRFLTSLYWSSIETIPLGYSFKYRIGNIGNTFIKSNLEYTNSFFTEKYGVNFTRKFVSYNTKWAGKLSVEKITTIRDIKKTDTTLKDVDLEYFTHDFWLGKSFLIKTSNLKFGNRTRLVLGFRYVYNNFLEGPEVSERYNFQFHNNQIALGSVAFARQKHFKSNLIYGFGKTEDIPIGTLIQFNTGIEKDEFYKRLYFGLKYQNGNYYPKIGYLNINAELGGYSYNNRLEQGAIKIKTQAISNLFYYNQIKLRNFLSASYTTGINRFSDEQVYLNSTNIWGLESTYLFGMQKLSFNSELVAFSRIHIYNFKFIFFGFADMGMIGPENETIFKQKLYTGVGLGLRIRNENLVFKTFQIRFAFYPSVPVDSERFYFLLSGENYQKPVNYEPTAPSIIDFN
jgi:hypothetical protein